MKRIAKFIEYVNSEAVKSALEEMVSFRFGNFINENTPCTFWVQRSQAVLKQINVIPIYGGSLNTMTGVDRDVYFSVEYLKKRLNNLSVLKNFRENEYEIFTELESQAIIAIVVRCLFHEAAHIITREVFYESFLGASPILSENNATLHLSNFSEEVKEQQGLETMEEPKFPRWIEEEKEVKETEKQKKAKLTVEAIQEIQNQVKERIKTEEQSEEKSLQLENEYLFELLLFGSYERYVENSDSFLDQDCWNKKNPLFSAQEL